MLSKNAGHPVLNDVHGLMTYDRTANPKVVFSSMKGDLIRGVAVEQFLPVYEAALSRPKVISDRERVSLELFNASFFQTSVDGRFLLLMSGLEALIVQERRSAGSVGFLETVSAQIPKAPDLDRVEKDALLQGIGLLKRESIGQAGRRLVRESLGEKGYEEMRPADFFGRCYRVRSRLVHGELPFPSREDVNGVVAQLEVMLSDLLSVDLLDVGPSR